MSTCEAEVVAAALGFRIAEGLLALFTEWGLALGPPARYQDNQSALVFMYTRGTWRARYFAVRAARAAEEVRSGTLDLRRWSTYAMWGRRARLDGRGAVDREAPPHHGSISAACTGR